MLRRKRSHRVIFEGQSLNNVPPDTNSVLGHGYPWHLMRGLGLPYNIPAVSGTPLYEPGWEATHSRGDLYSDLDTRVFPLIGRDEKTIVIICGGTSDVWSGNSGEEIYANHVQHAEAMYDAGADYVIVTTVCKANNMTEPMNTERGVCNSLLLANGDSVFTAVADLSVTPLEITEDVDPVKEGYNNPYYFDGVHWYDPGAIICADTVRPHLLATLAL